MTVSYVLGNSLYVNLTNRCTNRCDFCIRETSDGVGSGNNLWLSHEPTLEEALKDIFSRDLTQFDELVFCGFGEPTLRLEVLLDIARAVKEKCPVLPVRINTNGQANLYYQKDVTPSLSGLIDTVSVSLNAKDASHYDALCHSDFGEAAYAGLLDFAEKAKAHVPHVLLSVVDVLPEGDIELCRKRAEAIGVGFRVRVYSE